MRILLFGATGMVGQGVLRECLLDPGVEHVLSIVRHASGECQEKLREIVHGDFYDFSSLESDLAGLDACFFCLGVSSAGLPAGAYRRVTVDITLAAARTLVRVAPLTTFVYVSGMGTDSSERGRVRWARVKGETENALLRLPFKAAYMFRPAFIEPLHGIRSKTVLYQAAYTLLRPLFPALRACFPTYVTTTEAVGRAMLAVTRVAPPKRILENKDINELGGLSPRVT